MNGQGRWTWGLVFLLLGLGVLLFTAYEVWRVHTQPARTADADAAVRQVLAEQAAAWNRGDLDAFMRGYWLSHELSFFSGKDAQRGWQETLERYRTRYQGEGREMGQLTFSDLEVEPLGPDAAWVRGRWQVVTSKQTLQGLFTLVFRRQPEGWRIVHDHTSAG